MNQLQTEELLLLDEVQAEEEYKERFKITDLSGADWEGNEIYEGDEYVETEMGLVRLEDIPRFVKETQKVMVAGE